MKIALSVAAAVLLSFAPVAFAADAVAPVGAPAVAPAPVPLAIVVYDQPGFKGKTLRFDRAVPDLKAVNFDDKVASFEIQGAGDWMLCEGRNYSGRCVRGSAKADDLKVLQIAGRVSSLYPVPAPAAVAPVAPAPVAKP